MHTRRLDPAGQDPAEAAAALEDSEVVRPVYSEQVAELPRARALCDALYLLPERRRAACCERPAAESNAAKLAGQCAHVVSAAVASEALTLDDAAAARCVADLEAAHAGCDWVGPLAPELPPACEGVVTGARTDGQRCRSNFECRAGLRCAGVGPTDAGTCAPPAEDGSACHVAVDALATYLRLEPDQLGHPECAGYCAQHRCAAISPVGAACRSDIQCGPAGHCAGDTCVARRHGAPGEACADTGCAPGSRCVQGTCLLSKGTGEACTSDFECRGGCLREGTGAGACGPRCSVGLPGR